MPAKKDDPMAATHFMTAHVVGPFARGSTVTAEELSDSFGRNDKHSDEQHEKYRAASLKRLLDLGAISPAEAPEEPPTPDEEAKKADERRKADEDAARKAATTKHPEKK